MGSLETGKIVRGCRSCKFGVLDVDVEPCPTCYENHIKIPYNRWLFDINYDPIKEGIKEGIDNYPFIH